MKNQTFEIYFDKEKGTISQLFLQTDCHQMNFIKEGYTLNQVKRTRRVRDELRIQDLMLISFEETQTGATAVFRDKTLEVCSTYSFKENGYLHVTNRLRSLNDTDLFLERGEWGIEMPFNDEYPNAKKCMTQRCHTHIWCGLEGASYICCLKMGEEPDNLGVLATKGGWESYSQIDVASNNRGCFILNPAVCVLCPGEEYVMEYEIFPCADRLDFLEKCREYGHFIEVKAKRYSVFEGEPLQFTVCGKDNMSLQVQGVVPITCTSQHNEVFVSCMPKEPGEYRFSIQAGDVRTYAVFQVLPKLEELVKNRVRFIVEHQQYHKKGSSLDGAYLIYDNAEQSCRYDFDWADWNASRERVGMGILIARYLQTHYDATVYESLMSYEAFIRREIYCEETGQILDGVGDKNRVRLYNFLWVALFYTELFYLTKEEKYLKDVSRIVSCYYEMGGSKHYPNAVFISDFLKVLKGNGSVRSHFEEHVENVIDTGFDYPKHEVNYEQTIVSPAVALLLDACEYEVSLDKREEYLQLLHGHIRRQLRFDGFAPHYKLYSVAIRYWDGFWFGKRRQFGDTFPHYWSCLSSVNYWKYGELTGEESYRELGENGLRNCLCLFFPDGSASCASLFPLRTNGRDGEFYDEFANDQDFALYFAWRFLWRKI